MSNTMFADKIAMQHKLFAELSAMFGKEVPLYDKALLVNGVCNRTVCDLLAKLYPGFSITDAQLEKTSGERHGAIRIGRSDEYRWIGRFFAQFGMEPHNFYDMTAVGAKSQPIIATAFRAVQAPEHRVFTSLLQTNWFAPQTQERIEKLLSQRQVFSDEAKALIEKGERQGGLDWNDAAALIREGSERIFKWTGQARDHALYKQLCDEGFKIAADIACFQSHHLNHLTPNTLCMDLYTAAMKRCLGEMNSETFMARAVTALTRLEAFADRDWMRLHFKQLTKEGGPIQVDAFGYQRLSAAEIQALAANLTKRLEAEDMQLHRLPHAGYKDSTEGPSEDTPVLLRQDAYKALTEPVEFVEADGSRVKTTHTARFGEIEQRFYATTKLGRELYDRCLQAAELATEKQPGLVKKDFALYQKLYAAAFAPFAKTLGELLDAGLVYGLYAPTSKGMAHRHAIDTTDMRELVKLGYAKVDGLRYEDFLPVSAAGIFASNLNQYGTKSTAAIKPTYTQEMLENILGKKIINTDDAYQGMEARSILYTLGELGLMGKLTSTQQRQLESAAMHAPAGSLEMAMAAGK
jgi:uncharacterized glyoxalase superfamily metalloenzyme YdcJ